MSTGSTAKTRSRPNNQYVLYSYGEPVGMTNDSGTSYFGTDILGSVRSVTDKYGAVQSSYDYDAFGSPYLGNLENDIGFGYCGKVYDVGTGLYDYGFRDYSPVNARFTTVDPIRDGSNWFSYVVNDPVNYVDPLGLTATDSSNNTHHTLQKSNQGLKALTILKYIASGTMVVVGFLTGNPFLVAGGAVLSQVPTGMVVNKTNYDVAFAPEHGNLGEAYLRRGATFTRTDTIVTKGKNGKTSKGFSFGDYIIRDGEVIPSLGTEVVNAIANGAKWFLRETMPGKWLNDKIGQKKGKGLTTEPYNVYDTNAVLENDKRINGADLKDLSGNLNEFKNTSDGKEYLENIK